MRANIHEMAHAYELWLELCKTYEEKREERELNASKKEEEYLKLKNKCFI